MEFAETIKSASLSKYWDIPHSKKDDHVSICPIKIALIWGLCSYAPTVEPTQVASVGSISHDIPMIFPSYHNKTVTDYPHELLSNDIPIYHQHHCIVSPLVGSFSFPLFHHKLVLLWYWSIIHSHDVLIQNGWGTPYFTTLNHYKPTDIRMISPFLLLKSL